MDQGAGPEMKRAPQVREEEPEPQSIPARAAPLADLPEPPKAKPPMAPRASGLASLVATLGKEAEAKPPKATLPPPAPRPELPEFEPAPRWRRLVARWLDNFIATILALITIVLLPESIKRDVFLTVAIVLTPLAIYGLINLSMLAKDGQTVGKRLMRIRIVDEIGNRVGFMRAFFYRDGVVILIGFGVAGFRFTIAMFLPEFDIVGSALYVAFVVFSWVDILMIFSENRQCLHDRIAKTCVAMVPREY